MPSRSRSAAPAALDTPLLAVALAPARRCRRPSPRSTPRSAAPSPARSRAATSAAAATRRCTSSGGATRASSACCSSGLGKRADRNARARARGRGRRAAGRRSWARARSRSTPADLDARGVEAAAIGMRLGGVGLRRPEDAAAGGRAPRARSPPRSILVADASAQPGLAAADAIAAGYAIARTLAMMPGNVCTPDTFVADGAARSPTRHGMTVTVLGRAEMEARGHGQLPLRRAGHAAGPEAHRPRVPAAAATRKPVVLVGKGLCFDSGGISHQAGARAWSG